MPGLLVMSAPCGNGRKRLGGCAAGRKQIAPRRPAAPSAHARSADLPQCNNTWIKPPAPMMMNEIGTVKTSQLTKP